MKKIGILIENIAELSGGKRVAVNIANELTNYYDVYIINWYDEKIIFNLSDKIKIFHLLKAKRRMRYDYFQLLLNLRNIIKNENIDSILVIGRYISIFSFFSVISTKCKLVVCEHNSLEGYKTIAKNIKSKICNSFILLCYKYLADKIVFLTERDVNLYKKIFNERNKTVKIYNFLDEKLLDPYNSYKYNQNSKKIITVGRIDYQKGYEYLVQVAKIVFAKHPDWQWHIYGDGEQNYKNKIIDLIKQNNLENHLILQGNHSNIYDLYQNYSFYVMTSRYEGLPMVLLEAKAKKLPIVSFDINSGPSDIIRDGVDGFLIKPFDCEAMADKICELIENPELRQKLSDDAHGNLDKFSKEKIIKQWCDLIDGL